MPLTTFHNHTGVCLSGSFESNFLFSLSGSLEAMLEKSLNTSTNVLSPGKKKILQLTSLNIKTDSESVVSLHGPPSGNHFLNNS